LPTLKTARLTLQPFTRSDKNHLFSLYGDPEVMGIRKIGTQTKNQSDAQLDIILDHWVRKGFGLWAVYDTATNAFMGECGLRERQHGSDEIELSYGLKPAFWGNGCATEAAEATVAFGFTELGLTEIVGLANENNKGSLHVLNKIGFDGKQLMTFGNDTVVYGAVSREKWVNRCSDRNTYSRD
jgi:RimJ/RimL family protein N-acetyltransferase